MTVFLIAVLKLRRSYHDQIAGITLGFEKIFTNLWFILTQNIRIVCPEIHIIMRPSAHSVCPPSNHLPIPVCPFTAFYPLLPFFPTSPVIISALLPTSWYLQFVEVISGASLKYFEHHSSIFTIKSNILIITVTF
jgi:hypothetical protein